MKSQWDYHQRRELEVQMFAETLKGTTIIPEAKAEEKVGNTYMFEMFKIWGTTTENRLRKQLSDLEFNIFDFIKSQYPDTELEIIHNSPIVKKKGHIF